MECTLCLGYIIVLSSHCLVCGYLCVEGPPPLGRLLYELVLRSALVQVSAAARARLLYVLRPAQPRAVSYSAGRERARQQARSGGRCYQRRPPTATRNVIEPGPKELVVVSMCCGAVNLCGVGAARMYTRSTHARRNQSSPFPGKKWASGIYHFLINFSSGMGEWYLIVLILLSLLSLISSLRNG